ncbi:MAG: MmgE/PrpD family protein [Roseovarius sp.]
MDHLAQTLADYAANLRFEDIPQAVIRRARLLALDVTGSVLRASKDAAFASCLQPTLTDLGWTSQDQVAVPGLPGRHSLPVAALLSGTLGHALEFDDFHTAAMIHPSAPVVAAAFSVGQVTGACGRDVLAAIVAGFEVSCRIGLALDPAVRADGGIDTTAVAGLLGATAAAGRLYGLDGASIAASLAHAGSQAPVLRSNLAAGSASRSWQVGQAAMNGVIAATLARNGFTGPHDPVREGTGLLAGYPAGATPDAATAGLGEIFETLAIGIRPYPSSRYTHAALDGLAAIRQEYGLQADDFQAVSIGLHAHAVRQTAQPFGGAGGARNVAEAQFSMQATAAIMVLKGALGWDDYTCLNTAEIAAISARIEVRRDVRMEGLDHPFGAHLRIMTPQGEITRRVPAPSGEGHLFPSEQTILAKFFTLTPPVLGASAGAMADLILGLERIESVKEAFT